MRVLLVDDDVKLLDLLEEYLTECDIKVLRASSGLDAFKIIDKSPPDIIVLDVMMPHMDGLEVLKKVESQYPLIPVIMLTAKGSEADRIVGIEMGADDYMVKPFSPRELLARIKAIQRRIKKHLGSREPEKEELVSINHKKRAATFKGNPLELTSVEFEILSTLVTNKGIVLPRERLLDLARGKDFAATDRSIDVHISHIRKIIGDDPKNPSVIKTVRGVGYLFAGD